MSADAEQIVNHVADQSMMLCRGVIQEYLAYLQGTTAEALFGDRMPTAEMSFSNTHRQWNMKLVVIDDPTFTYTFKLGECPAPGQIRKFMQDTVINLRLMTELALQDLREIQARDPAKIPRPELFEGAILAFTPNTTAFLWNPSHGREMHDKFTKRIAFVWTAEGVPVTEHPDDFTGPQDAKNMTDSQAAALVNELAALAPCTVCGGRGCKCLS